MNLWHIFSRLAVDFRAIAPSRANLNKHGLLVKRPGLEVEWAGEIIEREWGKASKGGVRPVNGPFGHAAFLLIAQRKN